MYFIYLKEYAALVNWRYCLRIVKNNSTEEADEARRALQRESSEAQ